MKLTPGLHGAILGALCALPLSLLGWSAISLTQHLAWFGPAENSGLGGQSLWSALPSYIIFFALLGLAAGEIGAKQVRYASTLIWATVLGLIACGLLTLLTFGLDPQTYTPAFGYRWALTLLCPTLLSALFSALGAFHREQRLQRESMELIPDEERLDPEA